MTDPVACLDPDLRELLTEYVFGDLDGAAERAFEEHVLTCATCAEDLDRAAPVALMVGQAAARRAATAPRSGSASPRRRPPWLSVAAAAVVIVSVGVVGLVTMKPEETQWRSATIVPELALTSPRGEVSASYLRLAWSGQPDAHRYQVTIRDLHGPIWVHSTRDTKWRPPRSAIDAWPSGTLYWDVVATNRGGGVVAVGAEIAFSLRRDGAAP